MDDKIIVTIDREFGSGGHEVAKRLAERLGIAFYDEEIIQRAAECTGYHEEYIRDNDEKAPDFSFGSIFSARVRRKLQIHNTQEPENLFDVPTVEKKVKQIDKQRRRYYEFYTDNSWGGRDEYDLLINTSRAGIEGAVDIIEAYIKGGKDKDLLSDLEDLKDQQ